MSADKSKAIRFKCAGGATAQLLALSNAIYISNKLGKPFELEYFPTSTGTYWKFALKELLNAGELVNEESLEFFEKNTQIENGSLISKDIYSTKNFGYKFLLTLVHRSRLNRILRKLRREVVIAGKYANLGKINKNTSLVTGNYVPILDSKVSLELSDRFINANIPNPFEKIEKGNEIVIHYRLGDMRKMADRSSKFGGHGVVDPKTFLEILNLEGIDIEKTVVRVVSDEPLIAKRSLLQVGIRSYSKDSVSTIWDDLVTIAASKIFIGSMSQFSLFGASLAISKGGKVYLPSTVYGESDLSKDLSIDKFNYIDYKYLPSGHPVFSYE